MSIAARPPAVAAFGALAVATVAAFFVIQHLKVTTPLVTGAPRPVPGAINPVSGGTCLLPNPKGRLVPVSFRRMRVSFYLLNQPDVVDVEIVDAAHRVVATLPGSGRYMPLSVRRTFVWNGRDAAGRVVPDGTYDIRVRLVRQRRTVLISNQTTGVVEPVVVQTHPPGLRVTSVTPGVVAVPGHSSVTIRFTGNQGLRPRILIVRAGQTRLLKNYAATSKGGTSTWNGTLAGERPAPPGRYLVGLRLAHDRTCNAVQSPLAAAAAPQAVVTVR